MTEQHSIAKPKILNSIKPSLDDDTGQYRVQLLPTGLDLAKAMIVLIAVAASAPTVSHFSYRWLQSVQEAAESRHSVAVSDGMDSAAEGRPAHLPEKRAETSDCRLAKRQPPRRNRTDKVEDVAAKGDSAPPHSQGRKVSPRGLPPRHQATNLAIEPRLPKQKDAPRIIFFDNAGGSYFTKAERDAAESRRLAESLRRYPAMKQKQRGIMRQRAFTRLEMLDAQQQ